MNKAKPQGASMPAPKNQGEGDYEAARRYDDAAKKFVESGKVEKAAHEAAPDNAEQARDLKRAEEVGKSHAKGEVPGVRHTSRP